MKLLLFAALAVCASTKAFSQIPVTYYDFENNGTRSTFENLIEQQVNTGSTAFTQTNLAAISGAAGAGGANGGL